MKKDHWLYLATAAYGAAIWIAVAAASGRREAWDSELYFTTGMPLAGQFAVTLVTQGPLLIKIRHRGGPRSSDDPPGSIT